MYGKIINNEIQYPPVNLKTEDGTIFNYNQRTDLLEADGYKEVRFSNSADVTETVVEDMGEYIQITEPEPQEVPE